MRSFHARPHLVPAKTHPSPFLFSFSLALLLSACLTTTAPSQTPDNHVKTRTSRPESISKKASESTSTELPTQSQRDTQQFLNQFCLDCHGASEQNADRRFDQLPPTITTDAILVDYQEILDQLNLGRMPPTDADQPTSEQIRHTIQIISQQLTDYYQRNQHQLAKTKIRRLNAREYRNTVRDLFGLEMLMFDPTVKFPSDQTVNHFDNNAEALVTSGHLLQRHLEAAEQVIQKAANPMTQPQVQSWLFTDHLDQQPEIDQVHRETNGFTHLTLYDVIGADKHEGAYAPLHQFKQGVPEDGYYEIRFEAEALNRNHPYDVEFLGLDPSEPLRLGIVAGNQTAGTLHLPQPIEPLLAEQELADQRQWYTQRVWLDKGFTPRFTFRNGLMDARNLWARLIRKYPDQFPPGSSQGIVNARFNWVVMSVF